MYASQVNHADVLQVNPGNRKQILFALEIKDGNTAFH